MDSNRLKRRIKKKLNGMIGDPSWKHAGIFSGRYQGEIYIAAIRTSLSRY